MKAPEPWFVHKNYQAFLDGVFPAARVAAPEQIGDMLRAYEEALDAQEALYQKYEQKSDQLEYVRRIEGVFARMHKRIGTLQLVQVFAELRGRIEHFVLFSEDIFTKKADEVRLRQQLDRERRQQKESARARLLADVASMCEALVQDYVNKNVYTYKVFTDENYVTATQDLLRLDVDPANWQQVHDEAKAHAQLMRRAAEQICENGFDDAYFYKVADLEETVAEGVSALAEDVRDVYAAVTECRQQLRYYRLEFSRLASYTREQRDDLLELIRQDMAKVTETVQTLQAQKVAVPGVEERALEVMRIRKGLEELREPTLPAVQEARRAYEEVLARLEAQIRECTQ